MQVNLGGASRLLIQTINISGAALLRLFFSNFELIVAHLVVDTSCYRKLLKVAIIGILCQC